MAMAMDIATSMQSMKIVTFITKNFPDEGLGALILGTRDRRCDACKKGTGNRFSAIIGLNFTFLRTGSDQEDP